MEDSQSQDKACWTREMLNIFYDICIKAIKKSMRSNTYFDKVGYENIIWIALKSRSTMH